MNIQGIFSIDAYRADETNLPAIIKGKTLDPDECFSGSATSIQFIPGTASKETSPSESKSGNQIKINIRCRIAGNNLSDMMTLDHLSRIDHVYLVTDNSGHRYIIGSNLGPRPTLTWSSKNDPDGKGGKSIDVVITLTTYQYPVMATQLTQVSGSPIEPPLT